MLRINHRFQLLLWRWQQNTKFYDLHVQVHLGAPEHNSKEYFLRINILQYDCVLVVQPDTTHRCWQFNSRLKCSPMRRQGARGMAPPAHRAGAPGATCCAPGATCQNAKMVYSPLRCQGARGVAPPAHCAGALHTSSASAGAPSAAERRRGLLKCEIGQRHLDGLPYNLKIDLHFLVLFIRVIFWYHVT